MPLNYFHIPLWFITLMYKRKHQCIVSSILVTRLNNNSDNICFISKLQINLVIVCNKSLSHISKNSNRKKKSLLMPSKLFLEFFVMEVVCGLLSRRSLGSYSRNFDTASHYRFHNLLHLLLLLLGWPSFLKVNWRENYDHS